jgi:Predicted metal-dependent hydrolase
MSSGRSNARTKSLRRPVSGRVKGTVIVEGEKRFKVHVQPLRRWVKRTLYFLGKDASVLIFLVGKGTMDKNVLAFPAIKGFPRPDLPKPFLGEVYVNPDYIKAHGESLEYMVIHGILHLLGYVHERTRDRIRMERTEERILKFLRKGVSA